MDVAGTKGTAEMGPEDLDPPFPSGPFWFSFENLNFAFRVNLVCLIGGGGGLKL